MARERQCARLYVGMTTLTNGATVFSKGLGIELVTSHSQVSQAGGIGEPVELSSRGALGSGDDQDHPSRCRDAVEVVPNCCLASTTVWRNRNAEGTQFE